MIIKYIANFATTKDLPCMEWSNTMDIGNTMYDVLRNINTSRFHGDKRSVTMLYYTGTGFYSQALYTPNLSIEFLWHTIHGTLPILDNRCAEQWMNVISTCVLMDD